MLSVFSYKKKLDANKYVFKFAASEVALRAFEGGNYSLLRSYKLFTIFSAFTKRLSR